MYFFYDLGRPIGSENDALARAICALPSRKRQIVLLSYFCGLTDKQIGVKMNRVRSAIQASRTRALKEMRENPLGFPCKNIRVRLIRKNYKASYETSNEKERS